MMKNRSLLSWVVLLCGVSFLPACSERGGEPYVDPKEDSSWGYFEGTFDGTRDEDDMEASFENSDDIERVGSNTSENVMPGDDRRNLVINTGIVYLGDSESAHGYFSLSLSGLHPGTKYVTKPYWSYEYGGDDRYSTISLFRRYSADTPLVEFVPSEGAPFEISILDVDWFPGSGFPAIEAKLDGTLYNKDNPTESITVHAVYGSR
ncbi:MAG: DUF5025 domain-containing protein [Alistipes sp.]|jgi:hypothetical protein|nr:DUF5025 domain-containing protein [Alistipes sp.]